MAEQKLGSFEALGASKPATGNVFHTYVTDQRLVAIRVGGQFDGGKAFTPHLGLLGVLIGHFLEKRVRRQRAELQQANEQRTLDELLLQHPKNFEVRFDSIEKAELRKSGIFSGGAKASLLVTQVGQKPLKLNLQTKEAVALALPVLEKALPGVLQTDARLRPS
jgi:hypothetical protein